MHCHICKIRQPSYNIAIGKNGLDRGQICAHCADEILGRDYSFREVTPEEIAKLEVSIVTGLHHNGIFYP